MLKTEGVLHFTIPVKNLDHSEQFYREELGFTKIGRTDRIVFMRAGDDYFNLTCSENSITQNAAGRSMSRFCGNCRKRASKSSSKKTAKSESSSDAAPTSAIPTATSSNSSTWFARSSKPDP